MANENEIKIPGITPMSEMPQPNPEEIEIAEKELPINQRAKFFQEKISRAEEFTDEEIKELRENPLLITLMEFQLNEKIVNDTAEYYKKFEEICKKL